MGTFIQRRTYYRKSAEQETKKLVVSEIKERKLPPGLIDNPYSYIREKREEEVNKDFESKELNTYKVINVIFFLFPSEFRTKVSGMSCNLNSPNNYC